MKLNELKHPQHSSWSSKCCENVVEGPFQL